MLIIGGAALVWLGVILFLIERHRWGGRTEVTKSEIGALLIAVSGLPVLLAGLWMEVR